jgi:hypothetical protein
MDATKPACPRCGYDQSGAIAAWERNESACCPLVGMCTECGLEFAWRDLLNPVFTRQLRMFEHARRRRTASFFVTWWKAARPWSFWRWVRMEHEVVPRRLAIVASLGLVTTYGLLVALQTICLSLGTSMGMAAPPNNVYFYSWSDSVRYTLNPFGSEDWYIWTGTPILPLELVSVLTAVLMPLTFVLLPRTLRQARVRRIHIARVWAYGLIWIPAAIFVPRLLVWLSAFAVDALGTMQSAQPYLTFAWLEEMCLQHKDAISLGAVSVWLLAWWSYAAGRYLKLPHAPAIGFCMLVLSLVLAVGLLFLFPGGTWFMYYL